MINSLAAFIGVCLLLAMVPGPGAMVIVRQAVRDGRKSAFLTLLGNETALIVWGCAAACGLTALIAASQVAYDTMRMVGAAVLILLGVQAFFTARRSGPGTEQADAAPIRTDGWRSYSVGVVTNLTNPKAAVFAMSFLPQFIPHGLPVLPMLLVLAVLWAVVDALWFAGVIWFIGRAKVFFARVSVWRNMARVSGMVLIGLGLRLALSE